MFIAVTTDGPDLSANVSETFESAAALLLVETDTMQFEVFGNPGENVDVAFAQKIAEHDCEAVITGDITEKPFEMLVMACITRYYGYGHTAKEALDLMDAYKLEYIRNIERTDEGCGGHDHDGECNCGHHDDEDE